MKCPHDVPKSFYPGMWLRHVTGERVPYTHPTAEVIRVGRTRVTIHEAGEKWPVRLSFDEAREKFRKVYASDAVERPDWVKDGGDFWSVAFDDRLRIIRVRWGFASVLMEDVLTFWAIATIVQLGKPLPSTWERLRDEE